MKSQDDTVWAQSVFDCVTFTQKLWVPGHLNRSAIVGIFVCQGLQLCCGSYGNGGLSQHEVLALDQRRQGFHHSADVRGIRGIRALLLGSAHADEVHVGELRGFLVIRGEPQSPAI